MLYALRIKKVDNRLLAKRGWASGSWVCWNPDAGMTSEGLLELAAIPNVFTSEQIPRYVALANNTCDVDFELVVFQEVNCVAVDGSSLCPYCSHPEHEFEPYRDICGVDDCLCVGGH